MPADIAERRRSQKCIHHGMDQHIRVGMSVQSVPIWDLHAS
jgi:hypothetical protein